MAQFIHSETIHERGAGRDVSAKELKVEQETNRLDGWRGKVMHGQHVRQEFVGLDSWRWLKW